ncbi:hypothetical protein CANMA_002227 [Candida margitis]|uniref:uncharacterized protein n=1 Tax=Candida margitis TaxID=1775924 RepID=UPI0022272AF3|nr:uncharacterized protein CANMA_002227 [Candida margitis]KAI5968791.1 hypothetical protein CANMA_002227 [Candida margitis]
MNFRGKVLSNYGNNEQFYEVTKQYKAHWGEKLFVVDESLANLFKYASRSSQYISASDLHIKQVKVKEVDNEYVRFRFNSNLSANVLLGKTSHVVNLEQNPAHLKEFTNRNVFAAAVGGFITSMQWLPNSLDQEDGISYLAIGVISGEKELAEVNAVSPELNVFNNTTQKNIRSSLQIWKYEALINQLELKHTLVTSEFGAVTDIQWAPLFTDHEVLGVLGCVFKNGEIHLLKIDDRLPEFSIVQNPSYRYKSNSKWPSNLTCFSFVGTEKIIAGTADGYIMELELPFCKDGDLSQPNFKTFVSDGPISSVVSVPISTGEHVTIINGQAYRGMAFSTSDPLVDVFSPLSEKSTIKPTYNFILQDVLLAHNPENSNILCLRSLQDTSSTMLRLNSHMTTFKLSEALGHPFMLTGTDTGDIILMNYTRKFFSSKGGNKVMVPLKLWKFTLNETDSTISISADYEKMDIESPIQASYMPSKVMISAVAWNENIIGSSVYAAGTASGILLVERLDPKFQN